MLASVGSTSRSLRPWVRDGQQPGSLAGRKPQGAVPTLHTTSLLQNQYSHNAILLLTAPPDVIVINGCVQGQNSSVTGFKAAFPSWRQSLGYGATWEKCAAPDELCREEPSQIMWQEVRTSLQTARVGGCQLCRFTRKERHELGCPFPHRRYQSRLSDRESEEAACSGPQEAGFFCVILYRSQPLSGPQSAPFLYKQC